MKNKLLIIELMLSGNWTHDGERQTFSADGIEIKVSKEVVDELLVIAKRIYEVKI